MADKIKKFFAKKKMEAKFKLAGPGHRLNESTSSKQSSQTEIRPMATRSEDDVSTESRVAAAAALARLEQKRENPAFATSLAAVQARVRKELEAEKLQASQPKPTAEVKVEDIPKNLAIGGVFFRCPLISEEVLPRDEWKAKIKEFLYSQLEEEKGLSAALIIHSCNSGPEKIEACVNTLCKYLENIVTHPKEEKYRKIRMSNRAFQDRVKCMEGSMELLDAAGFVQKTLPGPDGQDEDFLVFCEDRVPSIDSLVTLIDALRSAEPVQLELDRGVRVLLASQASRMTELPAAFYTLTPEQIKREQQLRMEAVEKSQMLRTKAMREKEEMREMTKYRFALIRIRFPDGILLQGTFSIYERLKNITDFIKEHLEHSDLPFILTSPTGHKLDLEKDAESSLVDLRLVPTSVLNFLWDSSAEEVNKRSAKDVFLKPEVMLLVQELTF